MNNTAVQGAYRWMIFKESDSWIGVALEFNIVVTEDDPREGEVELQEADLGYLEPGKKLEKGFRPNQVHSILNQETDAEYETRWERATQQNMTQADEGVPSPFSDVYKAGIANLANV